MRRCLESAHNPSPWRQRASEHRDGRLQSGDRRSVQSRKAFKLDGGTWSVPSNSNWSGLVTCPGCSHSLYTHRRDRTHHHLPNDAFAAQCIPPTSASTTTSSPVRPHRRWQRLSPSNPLLVSTLTIILKSGIGRAHDEHRHFDSEGRRTEALAQLPPKTCSSHKVRHTTTSLSVLVLIPSCLPSPHQ